MLGFNVKCTILELENKIIQGDFDKEIYDYLMEILVDFNNSLCCNDAVNLLEGKSNPYDLFDFTIETDDGYLFVMPYETKYEKRFNNLKEIFKVKSVEIFENVVNDYNKEKGFSIDVNVKKCSSGELEKLEKDYLKLFLEIVDENGVDGLVDACKNKEFAMYPFVEIIRKIIKEERLY